MSKLIKKIDLYIIFFKKQGNEDPLALKMLKVLDEFKREAHGKPPRLQLVLKALAYDDFYRDFKYITLTQNNLLHYLIIQKFINEIKGLDSDLKSKVFNLLKQYEVSTLKPALYKFKESELSLQPKEKKELQGMFDELNSIMEKSVAPIIKQIREKRAKDLDGIVTDHPFYTGLGYTAKASAKIDNPEKYTIAEFMFFFSEVLEKEKPTLPEILELNKKAIIAQKAALNLPEIKEIKEYHWIINQICNFINQHICTLFSSQATKKIQGFFGDLDQKSIENRKKLEQVESELVKEADQQFHV